MRTMIEAKHPGMSIRQQCQLLGLNRRSYYNARKGESPENLDLMRVIDQEYTSHPFYGSRQMASVLRRKKRIVNRKRVQRLMRLMGLQAIYPKKRLSLKGPDSVIYPYLLRDVIVTRPNQVWAADITYVPMAHGYLYLMVIMDWYSRRIISWELYEAKYPAACECLQKDKDALLAFYDFPAEHWIHLRTTNPIESTFATVRLRTTRTKGCGSRIATLAMVYKLAEQAERHWRRLNKHEYMALLLQGAQFVDGVLQNAA